LSGGPVDEVEAMGGEPATWCGWMTMWIDFEGGKGR